MIKSLEIKNFESHEHTVLKDFSPGFNLICGRSNQGKTSILRALKLVCFNEFNPKSVRVGAKHCEIVLTTDKGVVKVVRGPKDNHWETTIDGETKTWDKVGKNLPEAVPEITGMNLVNLGGIEFNANFMDQLSAHFMLAAVDDKKASPSDRVRIVDAISGLTGVEELVHELSLANKGFAKAMGDQESEMKALEDKKYEKIFLDKEEEILGGAKKVLDEIELDARRVEDGKKLAKGHEEAKASLEEAKKAMAKLPDVEAAQKEFDKCSKRAVLCAEGKKISESAGKVKEALKGLKGKRDELPDVEKVSCEELEKDIKAMERAKKLLEEANSAKKVLEGQKAKADSLPDLEAAGKASKKLDMQIELLNLGRKLLEGAESCRKSLKEKLTKSKTLTEEENAAEKEIHELLGSVKICPFCGQPISAN